MYYFLKKTLRITKMEINFQNIVFFMHLVFVAINPQVHLASANFGVNFGTQGDNLPSPNEVISLYKQENIKLLRLFDPNPDVLNALRGSGIQVVLGIPNEEVTRLATDTDYAIGWVSKFVAAYANDVNFGWIAVGNEMIPGPGSEFLAPAMNNVLSGLNAAALTGIKISTVVNSKVLGISSPPSASDFTNEAKPLMNNIIIWLRGTGNPLLINIYPYFAYASNPGSISLDYALFNTKTPMMDGTYEYYSLFEAMVDSFYAALGKNGWPGATVVVSETGWPSFGQEPYTSKENAWTYNQRLIDKMKGIGTPRRPHSLLDIFIFSMFNEDLKPAGLEQNWGIHYPDMTPVYHLNF